MDDYMPQDEYFEWEDIVPHRIPLEVTESMREMGRSAEYRRVYNETFEEDSDSDSEDFQWGDKSAPTSRTTSFKTSFTLNGKAQTKDSAIDFPSYDDIDLGLGSLEHATPIVEDVSFPEAPTTLQNPESSSTDDAGDLAIPESRDCSSIRLQPFGNVNYLLHQWHEDDISASWRHLITKRKTWGDVSKLDHSSWKRHNNVARLENASWRTWSKLRFGCKTVSPQTINWSKHCDDTLLHGPLLAGCRDSAYHDGLSRDRTPSVESHVCPTPPILKKPSMAEILRRGSLPTFFANQVVVQGPSLSEHCLLTRRQTSPQHVEFSTPIPTKGSCSPRKSVKFEEEVRQYTIVNPVGDRRISRMVKRTRSTTLQSEAYHIDPTPAPSPEPETSYRLPTGSWNYNSESQEKPAGLTEWTWLGAMSEEENTITKDYFTPRPAGKQISPLTKPNVSRLDGTSAETSSTASVVPGSLTQFNLNTMDSSEVEDELDYLLASADLNLQAGTGTSSPNCSLSDTQSSEDSGEDDDYPASAFVRDTVSSGYAPSNYAAEPKYTFKGPTRGTGPNVDIMDEEQHALYDQIMEEFELGY